MIGYYLPYNRQNLYNRTIRLQEDQLSNKVDICAVCAWRADCNKKFSISGKDFRCADFSRDISIKEAPSEDQENDSDSK